MELLVWLKGGNKACGSRQNTRGGGVGEEEDSLKSSSQAKGLGGLWGQFGLSGQLQGISSEGKLEKGSIENVTKRQRSRSPSPVRKIARHLPGSRALRVGHWYRKTIRHHPSMERFNDPEVDEITFSRRNFDSLCQDAESAGIQAAAENDATAWDVLQTPIAKQIAISGRSKGNSRYENTFVAMEDLQPWKGFPTFDEIRKFSLAVPELRVLYHEILYDNAARKNWGEEIFNHPGYIPSNEETSLARNLHGFFSQLNHLFRLACLGPQQSSAPEYSGLLSGSKWVNIGGGKCASQRREKGIPGFKVPDLVAYWTDGIDDYLNVDPSVPGFPGDSVPCHLVGDFKMAKKFRHSHLLPYTTRKGNKRNGHQYWTEGKKVMSQIHDYMDMHHNRYGYVITQEELIMFRRRDDPPGIWGQVDYSPSIPVSCEKGKLNAMLVLWYFHVKYIVMGLEGGWKLPSCYHNCPKSLLGKSAKVEAPSAPKKMSG